MPQNTTPMSGGSTLSKRDWIFDGWNQGVNTFSLATELKGSELAQLTNGELYGKRAIRPRRGGLLLGNTLGGNSVDGLFQYKEMSVNDIQGISGGVLKRYNTSTESWDTISGSTFTANLRTRGVKMRSNIYYGNGVDNFTRYNGTTLATFTAVSAPSGLAVAQAGTTGSEYYSYVVTTVTDKGESLPCAVVQITDGNAILDTTNKINVTFDRKTESQVIGYNIYGRKSTGNGRTLMTYIEQPSSGATVTFADTGTITPGIWLPPDGDSTDGPTLAIWEQLRGSLVGAGDPNQPHRLYFSGTGTKYESFSPAHNGGWVDVRPGDNDTGINGLAPFESRIIVGKQRSIHQFKFSETTGDAVIQELITYVGCGAPGSMVVMENDIAFVDAERRLRILGYEPNFQSAIRTTTLTEGRTQSLFDDINPDYLTNCEGAYHNGRYYLAYTPPGETVNKKVLIYDRRYLSFIGVWDGPDCHVKSWLVWDGKDKRQRLYAGGSDSARVWEFAVEGKLANYDGSAITTTIRTRNEDLGNSGQSKLWKWADLRIWRISGTIKLKVILNGSTTISEKTFSESARTGWGVARWGTILWGESSGTLPQASDIDKTYRKELYEIGNSIQFEITKEGTQSDFALVSMRGEAMLLPTEVFDAENVI